MFGPCLVLLFSTLCLCSFATILMENNHLDGEERAGCFTFTHFLIFCDCQCSVTLSRVAVGWSVVCYFRYLRYLSFLCLIDSQCSVVLPRDSAVRWSTVCYSGIS